MFCTAQFTGVFTEDGCFANVRIDVLANTAVGGQTDCFWIVVVRHFAIMLNQVSKKVLTKYGQSYKSKRIYDGRVMKCIIIN